MLTINEIELKTKKKRTDPKEFPTWSKKVNL